MKKLQTFIFTISLVIIAGNNLFAQKADSSATAKSEPSKINVSVDLMSRYIWRGIDYGNAPSIQPTLSLTKGGFEIGSWGAFNTLGTYHELDPYAKYTIKSFSVGRT